MMRRSTLKANLLAVAALVAPSLIVAFGHEFIGAGPKLSAAAQQPDHAAVESKPVAPTAKQLKAASRAGEIAALAAVDSPFRPVARPAPVASAPAPAAPAPSPTAPTLLPKPEVNVRMILRQADGSARALINGESWLAGDAFADGWTIEAIDPAARSVTFTSADGQSFTVSLVTR